MPLYLAFATVACVAALIIIRWAHGQGGVDLVVTPAEPGAVAPAVSLLVPARNEQRNIQRCVESLLSQAYPDLEVIVVDDSSTDSTLAILSAIAALDPRLRVIRGDELPSGWAGKPHALQQAAAAATGEWLVFVDADTWLEPGTISATLAKALETGADLFTTLHRQVMGSFWERAVLPLVLLGLSTAFPPRKVNDPALPHAVANGQFLMIRRAVYEAVGGHRTVRSSIVDDRDIAALVKGRGYRLIVADGRDFVSTHMYGSLAEMWEGWTKNIFLGLHDHPGLLLLGLFGALLTLGAALLLPLWTLLGLAWYLRGGEWVAAGVLIESLIVWGYLLWKRAQASRSFGISAWYALSVPLGSALFGAMMFASAWKVISGRGVTWKGRTYR